MRLLFVLLFLLGFINSKAQSHKDIELARHYLSSGNFEKAGVLYEKLWQMQPNNPNYYEGLIEAMLKQNKYDKLEKIVKKQIKMFKSIDIYQIDLGYVFLKADKRKEAENVFKEVLNELEADESKIRSLAYRFNKHRLVEYAIKTYERGNELFKDQLKFLFELADLHLASGKYEKTINAWLFVFEKGSSSQAQRVKNIIQRQLDNEVLLDKLETALYGKVQRNANKLIYVETLVWFFIQKRDFEMALIQAKALDKRKNENGRRIFDIGVSAFTEKQYDVAIDAFQYVIDKGMGEVYYQKAKGQLLKTRKKKILSNDFTDADLFALKSEFLDFLSVFGYSSATVNTAIELANLEAYYLYDLDEAIDICEKLNALSLSRKDRNKVKLALGDYYLLSGDIWEATLLYAQVDKSEMNSPLGELARFKNAKLSYYKGEFEWAQAQLHVLKGSTSELVSNDAIELSVFIMDNLGLDTSKTAMLLYSKAELLERQNRKSESLKTLDSLLIKFPQHSLTDDVYFKQASIAMSMKNWENAVEYLNSVITHSSEDILADNAYYALAEIYENKLMNPKLAKENYLKILTHYSNSVLSTEARKRYRNLEAIEP